MDDLYEKYGRLLEKIGQWRSSSDKEMFYNLIREHHGIICYEHKC